MRCLLYIARMVKFVVSSQIQHFNKKLAYKTHIEFQINSYIHTYKYLVRNKNKYNYQATPYELSYFHHYIKKGNSYLVCSLYMFQREKLNGFH